MKSKMLFIFVSICVVAVFIGNAAAFAGAQEIKERMKARLPQVIDLKNQGVIGEDNKGFLAFVGPQKAGQDIVEAENADRKAVYEAIAKQTGSTVEAVGQRRALQIAGTAEPGEWIQNAGGEWVKK